MIVLSTATAGSDGAAGVTHFFPTGTIKGSQELKEATLRGKTERTLHCKLTYNNHRSHFITTTFYYDIWGTNRNVKIRVTE